MGINNILSLYSVRFLKGNPRGGGLREKWSSQLVQICVWKGGIETKYRSVVPPRIAMVLKATDAFQPFSYPLIMFVRCCPH